MNRTIAFAVFGFLGTIGTANADVINSTSVTIWSGATPGATSTSATQQGLPTATKFLNVNGLPLLLANTPFIAPINYDLTSGGTNTIKGFFTADNPSAAVPGTCNTTCQNTQVQLE